MQKFLALAAIVPAALAQTYYGCYTEIPARALTGASWVNYTSMTISDCQDFCTTGQYPNPPFDLWAVEYGGEWYVPLFTLVPIDNTKTNTPASIATAATLSR